MPAEDSPALVQHPCHHGFKSGYPVLDNEEGHGRLNYFDAADGYGAFTGNVAVTMNAGQGGFHAFDA